jgi:hypothetical protein
MRVHEGAQLTSQGFTPTVSWHEQEYIALGKDFRKRGKMLDEQFAIWIKVWTESPASYSGEFNKFDNIYVEPKLIEAGRDPKDFDIMCGIMGIFKGADDVADLDAT